MSLDQNIAILTHEPTVHTHFSPNAFTHKILCKFRSNQIIKKISFSDHFVEVWLPPWPYFTQRFVSFIFRPQELALMNLRFLKSSSIFTDKSLTAKNSSEGGETMTWTFGLFIITVQAKKCQLIS